MEAVESAAIHGVFFEYPRLIPPEFAASTHRARAWEQCASFPAAQKESGSCRFCNGREELI